MIASDTNILIRFLTRDDEAQFQKAFTLFLLQEEIFIPDTVILETEWVLRFAYKFSSQEIIQSLRDILGLPNVYVENTDKIAKVIAWYEKGLDFADAFHLANSIHLPTLMTFDVKFIKRAKELSQCLVKEPQ